LIADHSAALGVIQPQSGMPKLAIAKWAGPKELDAAAIQQAAVKLTEKAVEALGGLQRFVRKGDVVWVKPNIAWDRTPELAANTNPDVVATIVRLCFEAGAKRVKVGDNPCDIAVNSYERSGIAAAVRPLGAEVVFLDRSRFKTVNIKGEFVKTVPLYPEILECDLLINVPIAKHHGLSVATLCMKNYMGVMEERRTFHQAIAECLTDLTRFLQPRICILDAVRMLVARGPRGGNPQDVRLGLAVAAGTDLVALDAWGAEMLGRKPEEVPSIVKGHQSGLGTMNYRSLNPLELTVA